MQNEVVWYEVMAISEEFMKILEDIPEASMSERVTIGDKVIEGPKEVYLASSLEEVKNNLPGIIANLTGSDGQHIRIIERSVSCSVCAEEKKKNPEKSIRCTHGLMTVNQAWNVNIQKFLESQKAA